MDTQPVSDGPPLFLYNRNLLRLGWQLPPRDRLDEGDLGVFHSTISKVKDAMHSFELAETFRVLWCMTYVHPRAREFLLASQKIPQLDVLPIRPLGPDTIIRHMDTDYLPTAWVFRSHRMVPFEFMREDYIENRESLDPQRFDELWPRVVSAIDGCRYAEDVVIEHVESFREKRLRGWFPGMSKWHALKMLLKYRPYYWRKTIFATRLFRLPRSIIRKVKGVVRKP